MSKSRKTPFPSKQTNKNRKKPHPDEPLQKQAQQHVPKQREEHDATNGTAAPKPTKAYESETNSKCKATSSIKQTKAGALKEQEKIRAAEATEKQANAKRINTLLSSEGTTGTRTQPYPNQNSALDPEILP
jgi:hypothetical protein